MNKKNLLLFSAYLVFILSIGITLYFISPTEIVSKLGITNSYILVFFIALFGGFSSWTSFSMVAVIVALVKGGVSLLPLGLIAGVGLSIGDFLMFFVSRQGRELVTGKYDKILKKLATFIDNRLHSYIPYIIYTYIGLTPLPNDMLLISLGLIKYPKEKAYLPILLADMTYPTVASFLVLIGLDVS